MPIAFDRSICCDINETISREWLITNGQGGYAAGTIAGTLTRMQHGWLVASISEGNSPQLLLAKLDDEFAAQRITRLSPAAIAEVERMRRDHRRWISEISHRENDMLDSVGLRVSSSLQTQTGELSSSIVLRLAKEQDDLVRSLFTRSQYAQDPQTGLTRLRTVLRQMGG